MHIDLDYLCSDVDRHGTRRYYVRVPGRKKVRIREQPFTNEFMQVYGEALEGHARGPAAIRSGSFRWLCVQFYASGRFKALDAESTQAWMRRSLDSICEKHADKPVARMESRHVRKIRNEKQDYPAAANPRMKSLRALFGWAVEEELTPRDPTIGVKNLKYNEQGHHTWTAAEIAQYRQRHPVGTKARLALELIRYTTGRREDIPRLGPAAIYTTMAIDDEGNRFEQRRFRFIQGKNEDRKPMEVDFPVHPVLEQVLAATPLGRRTFLVTEWGKPYTKNGFGNAMRDWCNQANLPHCSAHGVRKSSTTEVANEGGTPHEIMGLSGHTSLKDVERYTRAADRKRGVDRVIRKLK